LRLIATGDDDRCLSTDLVEICRQKDLGDIANLGLTLPEAKTFIRSREEGERHLEVRVGNVETASGGRQVFGAVAKADTDISALIRQSIRAVGRTDDTKVTAFTDGCPGLRSILVDAGVTTPPILDWFHIAMRIQHAAQTASGLPTDDLGRMQAKSVIVDEVERLHLERQGEECQAQHRSGPQGHACLQG